MSASLLFAPRAGAVDPRGPQFAAGVTAVVLVVALVLDSALLLVAQTVVFGLGVAGRSPYVWLYRTFVRPRLGPPAELEDVRPLRFAQTVGLAFGLVALAGLALGLTAVTVAAAAAALAAAFLNAAFGVCLGCEAYLLLQRARRTGTTPDTVTRSFSEASA